MSVCLLSRCYERIESDKIYGRATILYAHIFCRSLRLIETQDANERAPRMAKEMSARMRCYRSPVARATSTGRDQRERGSRGGSEGPPRPQGAGGDPRRRTRRRAARRAQWARGHRRLSNFLRNARKLKAFGATASRPAGRHAPEDASDGAPPLSHSGFQWECARR